MSDPRLELAVLRILAQATSKGAAWVAARIAELEAAGAGFPPRLAGGPSAIPLRSVPERPEYLREAQTLGDAVVAAVKHIGRFTTSRAIVDAVRTYPVIYLEPDERQKRRKVSQALYVQSSGELTSVKPDRRTYWGLREWRDENGDIKAQYTPDGDEGSGSDDDDSN